MDRLMRRSTKCTAQSSVSLRGDIRRCQILSSSSSSSLHAPAILKRYGDLHQVKKESHVGLLLVRDCGHDVLRKLLKLLDAISICQHHHCNLGAV